MQQTIVLPCFTGQHLPAQNGTVQQHMGKHGERSCQGRSRWMHGQQGSGERPIGAAKGKQPITEA